MNMRHSRPPGSAHWTDRLRASLPSREMLMANPWLKPIAHRLLDPPLWRLQHEAVARGVALGYVSVKPNWRLRVWLKRRYR